jgi:soluble lytic murein transglycosylase-like protein
MLIYPVDGRRVSGLCSTSRNSAVDESKEFARLLESSVETGKSGGGSSEKATLAAEILRLDMMRSAVSLGDNSIAPETSSISSTLKSYLTNSVSASQKTDTKTTQLSPQEANDLSQLNFLTTPSTESTPSTSYSLTPYDSIIKSASAQYGVDEGLIKAVIKQESNFNTQAVSKAGAKGLMQLMPGTASGLGVKDSFDPAQNIMAGARYLRDMLDRYNGDVDSALAAYNWGPGNVDKNGCSSLPRETKDYLVKVKKYYSQFVG